MQREMVQLRCPACGQKVKVPAGSMASCSGNGKPHKETRMQETGK